jgi:hypothetical protein
VWLCAVQRGLLRSIGHLVVPPGAFGRTTGSLHSRLSLVAGKSSDSLQRLLSLPLSVSTNKCTLNSDTIPTRPVSMSKVELTPASLAADLVIVRYYGIGRPLGNRRAHDIPALAHIARDTFSDSEDPLHRLIERVVQPAITRLAPEQYKLAAAALLWVDLERDGVPDNERTRKGVTERRAEAAALMGKKPRNFEKRYEHRLLEELGEQLIARHTIASRDTTILTSATRASHGAFEARLLHLAFKAARLHYTALVPLFVAAFSGPPLPTRVYIPNRLQVYRACREVLFQRILDYIYEGCTLLPLRGGRPGEDKTLEDLGTSTVRVIEQLNAELCAWPPPLPPDSDIGDILFYLYDQNVTDTTFDTYFAQHWTNQWFGGCFDGDSVSPLELVAAKAGALERHLSARIRHDEPFLATSRRLALKQISSYYDVEEWVPLPILRGGSLRSHAEGFFDTTRARLDADEFVWYDSSK